MDDEFKKQAVERHLRIDPRLRSDWKNLSNDSKIELYDTFSGEIRSIINNHRANNPLRYTIVENGMALIFHLKYVPIPNSFYFLLTEIEPAPEQ